LYSKYYWLYKKTARAKIVYLKIVYFLLIEKKIKIFPEFLLSLVLYFLISPTWENMVLKYSEKIFEKILRVLWEKNKQFLSLAIFLKS